jgi:drug/metabolite transporter (DMT)-like permease
MSFDPHRHRQGLWMALIGAVAFSGKAIIIKLGYRLGSDAVTLIMLRMALALPFFALMAWWGGRGRSALTRRDLRWILLLGFLGYYLASMLDFLGLAYISASLERLVLYLNPTFVMLLAWGLYGRRPNHRQWSAVAVSYLGVLIVFGHEASFSGAQAGLGVALVLGSGLSYAMYLLFSGEEVRRLGALRLTGWASCVACGFSLVQYLVLRSPADVLDIPTGVWALSALNAIACTVTPVLLVMMAIERLGSALTAQTGMIGPIATLVMGAIWLDEPLTAWVLVGTVLVLGGVSLQARVRA